MPVSTRHMRKGAHISARRSWAMALFKHLGESLHVEIDGLDEGVSAFYRAYAGGEEGGLGPRVLSHALDELEVAPRLRDDHLHLVLFHEVDQLGEMVRRGGNARALFDRSHLDEAEPRQQIYPHGVSHHHRRSLVWLERLVPAAQGFLETGEELLP